MSCTQSSSVTLYKQISPQFCSLISSAVSSVSFDNKSRQDGKMSAEDSEVIVNREEFYNKLSASYSEKPGSNRSVWNKATLENVKQILENPENKKVRKHFHYFKTYDILRIGDSSSVILKRKDETQPIKYMVCVEDYYDKLLEAHIQTGHGGRDKMLYYIRDKYRISKNACEVFASCCHTCNRKKALPKRGVVVKPITTDGFNIRAQVDLIDLQSTPDGEYKWLLNLQDHATKFCHLRPLKSKHAASVAEVLFIIFLTWGCPMILQSDNGREFVAAIIFALLAQWPHCKMIHGRPRHPQSQGSVERSNQDVENMLRAWMVDNNSKKWTEGCYIVQVIIQNILLFYLIMKMKILLLYNFYYFIIYSGRKTPHTTELLDELHTRLFSGK